MPQIFRILQMNNNSMIIKVKLKEQSKVAFRKLYSLAHLVAVTIA